MKTILVVDDSPDMLALQRTVLELEGFRVLSASGGEEALRLIDAEAGIDLVLLDVQMPGLDGPGVIRRLEETRPEVLDRIPFVFLTGEERPPDSRSTGWLRKMTDLDAYVAEVRRLLH